MKRTVSILCVCALTLALAACSGGSAPPSGSGAGSPGDGNLSSSAGISSSGSGLGDSSAEPGAPDSGSASQSQPGNLQTATLYIGMDRFFREYPLETEAEITPTLLVEEISRLTGWNLDLAGEITSGKGGMTVIFADTCALFSGPPDPQKDEFHVFAVDELDQTILDSVKKTLQNWAVVPGLGDPDSVDIYFCGPDGGDLVLENIGVTVPFTEPYRSFPMPQ